MAGEIQSMTARRPGVSVNSMSRTVRAKVSDVHCHPSVRRRHRHDEGLAEPMIWSRVMRSTISRMPR
jgi:hypothetical protein